MNKPIRIVFLYTELAMYFLACINELKRGKHSITVVHWPVNDQAPFNFVMPSEVEFYDKSKLNEKQLNELIDDKKPSIIVSSGWIDKQYNSICKRNFGLIPTVMVMDNQWKGKIRQHLASWVSSFAIKTKFSHIWVPGDPQEKYANKLGFVNIEKGYYSADFECFNQMYKEVQETKANHYPKRLLYVGRYLKHKGVYDLWDSFLQIQQENPNEWELWCLGTGDEYNNRVEHPKIKHFGFVQPNEMQKFVKETGVFVLPSHFEPWGVVVHEFAAAGFPIICSNAVGAATAFVEEGANGLTYNYHSINSLKEALKRIMNTPENELLNMGRKSNELAKKITPKTWANTLLALAEKG